MSWRKLSPAVVVAAALAALLAGPVVAQAASNSGRVVAKPQLSKALQAKLQARIDHVQKARAKFFTDADRRAAGKRLAAQKAKAKAQGKKPRAVPTPGGVPDYLMANWAYSPELRKFVDKLPGLGPTAKGNLGTYVSIAVPDTVTYPGSDYYEISVRQFRQKFHRNLSPTLLRGYVQTNKGTDGSGNNTIAPAPIMYLGPIIVAQKDRPVRIKFTNELPTGLAGNLFLPVDTTVMGAGMGPVDLPAQPGAEPQREYFTQNRAVIHLHGGHTPWISDGTPHQWITPAGEQTSYPRGVSMRNVPDMPDPGAGSQTYYFTNEQSARMLFYHDHSFGITRLNVYAGEAAGYLITDDVEQDLVKRGVIPGAADTIPLVIQDKTFVKASTVRKTDPTWNWGSGVPDANGIVPPKTGDLWYPHVYVPAQNPYTEDGANPFGRWHYGPWFWPPTKDAVQPVANPYYDPVNAPWEPPESPGVPNVSIPGESFMDTPVVNGVAYPTVTLEPKAYRLRILNAANDRMFNLQLYVADPKARTKDKQKRRNTEVKMVPAKKTKGWPASWPIDGREGGVPDPKTRGPNFIQIGSEGGFLPYPAVVKNQPVTWNTNPTTFNFGNVQDHALLVGSAERADVIVDFSKYAGKTLILYNDAPAAFPAIDARYDYYTGNPDQRDSGGYKSTKAGYGPNMRTVMQIKIKKKPRAKAFNLKALQAEFTARPGKESVFQRGQNPIIVAQKEYNKAYGQQFPTQWPLWGYSRIQDNNMTIRTVAGADINMYLQPKAIQDEMGEAYDEYGRMMGKLGLELPITSSKTQNFVLQNYEDPTTEIIEDSITPMSPVLGDGTQIWKITHNGVDTHTIHFHLFDVQLINRVGWDGAIRLPDPNELGWKDTIRVSPLEGTIVALRATSVKLPFGVPDSVRPYNPAEPIGSTRALTSIDPVTGQPIVPPVTNQAVNFGWEYVWHCHLLSHEEMDMMRPIQFNVKRNLAAPSLLSARWGAGGQPPATLKWTDPTPWDGTGPASTLGDPSNEQGFRVERAVLTGGVPGAYEILGATLANVTTYTDNTAQAGTDYRYRVVAFNVAGDTASNTVDLTAGTVAPGAPSNLVAAVGAGPQVVLSWADNATGETGYNVWRQAAGGTWVLVTTTPADATTYTNAAAWDATVVAGTRYDYVVQAVNGTVGSLISNTVRVTP
jgi:FtsP/CotA-like multicopper oxidase with cupredoxin domain